jgi:hypothetical protein
VLADETGNKICARALMSNYIHILLKGGPKGTVIRRFGIRRKPKADPLGHDNILSFMTGTL